MSQVQLLAPTRSQTFADFEYSVHVASSMIRREVVYVEMCIDFVTDADQFVFLTWFHVLSNSVKSLVLEILIVMNRFLLFQHSKRVQ